MPNGHPLCFPVQPVSTWLRFFTYKHCHLVAIKTGDTCKGEYHFYLLNKSVEPLVQLPSLTIICQHSLDTITCQCFCKYESQEVECNTATSCN